MARLSRVAVAAAAILAPPRPVPLVGCGGSDPQALVYLSHREAMRHFNRWHRPNADERCRVDDNTIFVGWNPMNAEMKSRAFPQAILQTHLEKEKKSWTWNLDTVQWNPYCPRTNDVYRRQIFRLLGDIRTCADDAQVGVAFSNLRGTQPDLWLDIVLTMDLDAAV